MVEPFKVGIIGYGKQGAVHAEVWAGTPEVELIAIVDVDPARRDAAAQLYGGSGCQVFKSGVDMVLGTKLDVVVVATQPEQHYSNIRLAIHHGCHVILEKPMALILKEADEMVEAAERAGVQFAVHHQTIFTNAVQRAEKIIAAGEIGKLYFVEGWCKGRPAPYDLMEVGGHVLHLMRYFAGEPVEVYGRAMISGRKVMQQDARPIKELYPEGRHMGIGVGDYLFGEYQFASGVCGTIRLMTFEEEYQNTEYMAVELHGTRGRLRIHQTSTARLFYKPSPHDNFAAMCWQEVDSRKMWNPDPRWVIPMRRFAEDFVIAIREGRAPKVPGEDGRQALEMALGIYASHLAGRPLKLPLEERKHPLQ